MTARFPRLACSGYLVAAALGVLLSGCSPAPSVDDGRRALLTSIDQQSQNRVGLIVFKKTNGVRGEMSGVKIYLMQFQAAIGFSEDCKWSHGLGATTSLATSKLVSAPDTGFGWNNFLDTTTTPGTPVRRGQTATIVGTIQFLRMESGWVVDSVSISERQLGGIAAGPPPSISRISPQEITASWTGNETLTVTGSNFMPGAKLLHRTEDTDDGERVVRYSQKNIKYVSQDTLEVPFDGIDKEVNPLPDGLWKIRVVNPDGQTSNVLELTVLPSATYHVTEEYLAARRKNLEAGLPSASEFAPAPSTTAK